MGRVFSLLSVCLSVLPLLQAAGEVRCYCDAPCCVATGYMCKSPHGSCFRRALAPHTGSPLVHGCVGGPDGTCDSPGDCCHEDMCNYRGTRQATRVGPPHKRSGRGPVTRAQDVGSLRQLWFRAAVIAVPIAGGLALALLVALAVRVLRGERRRARERLLWTPQRDKLEHL